MTSDGIAEVTKEMSTSLINSNHTSLLILPNSNDNELVKNEPDELRLLERKDFLFLEELGEGSFSTVFLASEKKTRKKFAIKVCYKSQIIREKKIAEIFREKEILQTLSIRENSHPNVVQLFSTFQDRDSLYFVLTLATRHDLLRHLKKAQNKMLTIEQSRFIIGELLLALEHIHSLGIVHRDLKPENLLINETGHIMVSDFGCAKRLTNENKDSTNHGSVNGKKMKRRSSFVGTSFYVSPEVLNGCEVDETCDYWTFGVILFEILCGRRPFSDVSEYLTYQRILKLLYKFDDNFVNEDSVQDFIKKFLVIDTKLRFGSKEQGGSKAIKSHAFFVNVDWENLNNLRSPLL